MPSSSLPAAPVDSAAPPDAVPVGAPAVPEGFGDPVWYGPVELPVGITMRLPLAVADAWEPDAEAVEVAVMEPEDLGRSVARTVELVDALEDLMCLKL
jgi:hypothetical protein